MASSRVRQLLSLAALSAMMRVGYAAPTAKALFTGGGLTILSQNVLDGAQNDGLSAAILVHQASPYAAMVSSCALLGETLWNPDVQKFDAALNSSLAYQVFQGLVPADQRYWIAKKSQSDDSCRAMDTKGQTSTWDCIQNLPALCTQNAPVSNSSFANNTASWQVNQIVNNVQLTGYRDFHTFKFRGVRYAPTPARFTYATVKPYDQSAQLMAVDAGADCSQPIGEVKSGSSEDCLFLNIWTPYLTPLGGANSTQNRPVMVYFYGGGFTSGSGKNPNTDGTNLASRGDVVVVSVNYRVGNIGFLAFNDGVHKGNYGISDMIASLGWVKENIKYFGGDASRVTIFGESAGAEGTHILLASPKAKGLFHRAIMQSDPSGYSNGSQFIWSQYDAPERAYNGSTRRVLSQAGCGNATDQIACLGKLSGFDLVNLTTNFNGATADGTYLLNHEWDLSKPQYATDVDVMTGVNRDELGIQVDNYPTNGTDFTTYFNGNVGKNINLPTNYTAQMSPAARAAFLGTNGTATPEQIFNASVRIATDGVFKCFELAKAYAGAHNHAFKSTYYFEFNRTYQTSGYTKPWCEAPKSDAHPNGDPRAEYYKCHAGEQMIVFGTERRAGRPDRDGLDVPFMQLVVDYWSWFARTGDPNPEPAYLTARGHYNTLQQVQATGKWEQVDASKPTMRLLQWNGAQVPFSEAMQCDALGVPLNHLA